MGQQRHCQRQLNHRVLCSVHPRQLQSLEAQEMVCTLPAHIQPAWHPQAQAYCPAERPYTVYSLGNSVTFSSFLWATSHGCLSKTWLLHFLLPSWISMSSATVMPNVSARASAVSLAVSNATLEICYSKYLPLKCIGVYIATCIESLSSFLKTKHLETSAKHDVKPTHVKTIPCRHFCSWKQSRWSFEHPRPA